MRSVRWIWLLSMIVLVTLAPPVAAEDGEQETSFKKDKAVLKEAAKSEAVEEELEEPDGVSIDMSDGDNWKIFSVGTGTYDFNDADDWRDATQEAQLMAKAALAKYIKENLSTSEQMDRLVETKNDKSRSGGTVSKSATKKSLKTTLTSIRNSADEVLTGIIFLESTRRWDGDSGTVTVKIGQSQKTVDAAKRFRNRTAASLKSDSSSSSKTAKKEDDSKPSTVRKKSKSDF